MDVNCNFNQVSVKIYFNNKRTNIHTNTHFDNNHVAVESNNHVAVESNLQVPQTPVVIATIGKDKLLTFEEFSRDFCGENRVIHVKGTRELKFYQKSGSTFLMNHWDEELNKNGMFWKHFPFGRWQEWLLHIYPVSCFASFSSSNSWGGQSGKPSTSVWYREKGATIQ
jgi:hypothetical protein